MRVLAGLGVIAVATCLLGGAALADAKRAPALAAQPPASRSPVPWL